MAKDDNYNRDEKFDNKAMMWEKRYTSASTHQESMFKRYAQWYDTMYAVINTDDFAPWRSKIFIPILSSKAWNLISKLLDVKPGFRVRLREEDMDNEEAEDIVAKIQRKLAYDYDNPNLEEPVRAKLLGPLMDAVVCGMGVAKVPWRTEKRTYYTHPIDPVTESLDMSKQVAKTRRIEMNDLEPVNIFNVFFAPSATSFYSSPWIIIREFKTLSELYDINNAKGVEIYKNLDRLKGVRADSDRWATYNVSRNRLTNTEDVLAADETVDQIELFECYDLKTNHICTYAKATNAEKSDKEQSTWVEIRRQKNPYWHGRFPLTPFYIKRKPHTVFGEGIFEVAHRLQAGINDVFNHYLDNFNLSVDGMVMVDEDSQVEEYLVQPGGEMVYRGNPPQQFKFPEPNPAQISLVMTEIQKAIENVTISSYATGTPDSSSDSTQGTATGIIRLQEAAGDIIGFMRANFRQSLKQIGWFWLSNNQQFLSSEITIPTMENGVEGSATVRPEDFQYEFELTIDEASMEPLSKQEQRENFLLFVAQLTQLQKSSIEQATTEGTPPMAIDYVNIASEMADKFGFQDFQRFFTQGQIQPPAPMGMEGGTPPMPADKPGPAPNPMGDMIEQAMQMNTPPLGMIDDVPSDMAEIPLPPGAAGGLA